MAAYLVEKSDVRMAASLVVMLDILMAACWAAKWVNDSGETTVVSTAASMVACWAFYSVVKSVALQVASRVEK